ncbi:hypothetical protein [Arsukibacterium sp. UBA3155]|uniref:hypothetical protein n=1 Tax=Arsukibacterium sp. UBA3155 TaxID=1946058 RepID=UPI0025BB5AF5|nr:hypothetical protein [Arsukibacterium sp. UBA3155]|tara:strand:+ start:52831 stop:53004 length:174 start_codon:yes stop_codon:yes gene_type:complete
MNTDIAINELQRLAESITEQDIAMMISHGGATSVHEYLQRAVAGRINYLQHQQEATR